jgi:hypothetical protein
VAGYRTAAAPPPTVTKLRVAGPHEGSFYVLASFLAVAAVASALSRSVGPAVTTLVIASLFALFGRYGRARAQIELHEGSGALVLVTYGFLMLRQTRELSVEDVDQIRCLPIERGPRHFGETLTMPVIALKNGALVHVFGRPMGLQEGEARRIAWMLEEQIAAARPWAEPPRTRVNPEDVESAPSRRTSRRSREG